MEGVYTLVPTNNIGENMRTELEDASGDGLTPCCGTHVSEGERNRLDTNIVFRHVLRLVVPKHTFQTKYSEEA